MQISNLRQYSNLRRYLKATCCHVVGSSGYREQLIVAVLDGLDELYGGAVGGLHAEHHATCM